MKTLSIERKLDESTRKQGIWKENPDTKKIEVYSMHITDDGEVIITDNEDYSKIYAIYSADYYNNMMH